MLQIVEYCKLLSQVFRVGQMIQDLAACAISEDVAQ